MNFNRNEYLQLDQLALGDFPPNQCKHAEPRHIGVAVVGAPVVVHEVKHVVGPARSSQPRKLYIQSDRR